MKSPSESLAEARDSSATPGGGRSLSRHRSVAAEASAPPPGRAPGRERGRAPQDPTSIGEAGSEGGRGNPRHAHTRLGGMYSLIWIDSCQRTVSACQRLSAPVSACQRLCGGRLGLPHLACTAATDQITTSHLLTPSPAVVRPRPTQARNYSWYVSGDVLLLLLLCEHLRVARPLPNSPCSSSEAIGMPTCDRPCTGIGLVFARSDAP